MPKHASTQAVRIARSTAQRWLRSPAAAICSRWRRIRTNTGRRVYGRTSAAPSGGRCSTPLPVFGKQISITSALETTTGFIAGASHALWLDAIPSGNDTLLFAGTQDLFRCSLAAGCVWRNTTNVNSCAAAKVGPNQHGVVSTNSKSGTPIMYFANDRGLWRSGDAVNQQQPACSPDDAAHFDNLNATLGSLAEVTSLAQDPADTNQLLAGIRCGGNGRWSRRLLAVTTERSRGIHCCRMGREYWHVVCDFGRWSFDQQVRGGSVMRARSIRQWSRNRQRPGERRRLGAGCASSVDTGSGRSDADDSGNLQGVARASRWNQLDVGECTEPHVRREQCAGVPVEQHAGARSGCNGCGLRTRR